MVFQSPPTHIPVCACAWCGVLTLYLVIDLPVPHVESISLPHVGISSAERIQQQRQAQCSYTYDPRAVLAMAILKSLLDDCR